MQSGLAGALGTVEVRPLDLTSAYGALANGGVRVPPRMILEIEGPDGNVVWKRAEARRHGRRLTAGRLPRDRHPGRQHRQEAEPDLGREAGDLQREGRRTSSGRGQDRHVERRARPRDVRLPRAPEGRPAGPRRRRLDGQQRPLEPALEATGHLADRGRSVVARLRARLHEVLAGHGLQAPEGRRQGHHRRLDRRPARPVDEGDDDAPGSSPGRNPAPGRRSIPTGCSTRRPAGAGASTSLKAELGPSSWDADVADWMRRARGGPGRTRAVRLADGLLLEASRRGVARSRARATARGPTDDRDRRARRPGRPRRPGDKAPDKPPKPPQPPAGGEGAAQIPVP